MVGIYPGRRRDFRPVDPRRENPTRRDRRDPNRKRVRPEPRRAKPPTRRVPPGKPFYRHQQPQTPFGKRLPPGTPARLLARLPLPGPLGLAKIAIEILGQVYSPPVWIKPSPYGDIAVAPGWTEHWSCASLSKPYPYGTGMGWTFGPGGYPPGQGMGGLVCTPDQAPQYATNYQGAQTMTPVDQYQNVLLIGATNLPGTRFTIDDVYIYPYVGEPGFTPAAQRMPVLDTKVGIRPFKLYNPVKTPYALMPYTPVDRGPKATPKPAPAPALAKRAPQKKEKKLILTPGSGSLVGVGLKLTTEGGEAIDAWYGALPDSVRKRGLTPQAKLGLIIKHWDKLDVKKALANMGADFIEDAVLGRFGKKIQKATRDAYNQGYIPRGHLGLGIT